VRHLWICAALLVGTAACAVQPYAPVSAPGAPPPAPIVLYLPTVTLPTLLPLLPEPGPGRLTLSNFSFDRTRVLAVATTALDCYIHLPGELETEFEVPLNGTRLITAPAGADICWKRQLVEGEPPQPLAVGWTDWNRAYVAEGTAVNSRM
jgi:hypothetical protein